MALGIGLLTISSGIGVFGFRGGELSPKPLRFNLGGISLDQSSVTEIARLRRATRELPQSALAHMDLGVALSHAGRYAEALTEFETVLKLRPEDSLATYDLGLTHLKIAQSLGSKDRATYFRELELSEEKLRRSLILNPQIPKIHEHLGWLDHEIGDQASAIEEFYKAVDADPTAPEAYNNLGTSLAQAEKYEDAIHAYEKSFALAPDSVSTVMNLEGAIRQGGKVSDALQRYERRVQEEFTSVPAHLLHGIALYCNNQQPEALDEMRWVLQRVPNLAVAHFYVAEISHQKNDLGLAEMEYRKAIALAPERKEFLKPLAVALFEENKTHEAEPVLREALRNAPADSTLHYQLGRVLQKLQRQPEAAEQFAETSLLNLDEHREGILVMSLAEGIRELRAGKIQPAIQALQDALAVDSDHPESNYYLGIALSQAGDVGGSTRAFENALRRRPGSAEIHYNFGIALWEHGQPARAIEELRRAISIRPEDGLGHCALGRAQSRYGKRGNGERELAIAHSLGACTQQTQTVRGRTSVEDETLKRSFARCSVQTKTRNCEHLRASLISLPAGPTLARIVAEDLPQQLRRET